MKDIQNRTLEFGIRIIKLVDKFPKTIVANELAKQLIRSGTSIGANLQEADSASSRKDFINKLFISKKEARETSYWLIIVKRINLINNPRNIAELESLLEESDEIIRILGSILTKSRKHK